MKLVSGWGEGGLGESEPPVGGGHVECESKTDTIGSIKDTRFLETAGSILT